MVYGVCVRLFVGIAVPERLAIELAEHARSALLHSTLREASVRWTHPCDAHITLSFLGQVDEARLPAIEQQLTCIRAAPFRIELNAFGAFPRAGVFFASIKTSFPLGNLAQMVQLAMEQAGFPREERPYTPHITVARIGNKTQIKLQNQQPQISASFSAESFHLYRSHAQPGGARYQILTSHPLRS